MLDPRIANCKGKLFGVVGLIFVSGMLAGAVTMNLADRYWLRPKPFAMDPLAKEMAVQHFSQELELDEAQARAIEEVLDEFIMQQADLMAQFRTSRTSGHDRILQILNEEQRKRFKKVLEELSNPRKD